MTGSFMKTCAILVLAALTGCSWRGGTGGRIVSVRSPDGKNVIIVERLRTKDRSSWAYSVEREGKKIATSSVFKVVLSGKGQVTEGARLRELKEGGRNETFLLLWGKSRIVRNICSEARLRLESSTGILWDLELRAYDDGVAFRYGFPDQEGISDFVLEEAFTRYEEWGIRGLMVDFLDRNDQEMVLFCERVLESAARHRLHVQFHGSYMPSGEHRTFPNLFNREGVLNLEYLKWSARCTPQHNINVANTRNLAGPTDYHLGGFRAIPPDRFQPRNIMPNVLGTRCHHLAMYVVYENPMPMVCDTPSSYEEQAGFEFLKKVPTTWDETRFLRGRVGDFVVVARRKDSTWYLGGMTNDAGRKIAVPLYILDHGEYEAQIFVDGSINGDEPNAIRLERQAVTAGTSLEVAMAPGGGFVAVIRPKSSD